MKWPKSKVVSEPATVEACRQDRGTPLERVNRGVDAVLQSSNAKAHAKAAAEAPGGGR